MVKDTHMFISLPDPPGNWQREVPTPRFVGGPTPSGGVGVMPVDTSLQMEEEEGVLRILRIQAQGLMRGEAKLPSSTLKLLLFFH